MKKLQLSLALAMGCAASVSACTVIAVGNRATIDGSTLVAHTDDAGGAAADVRLVRVPAQTHAPGAQRAVYNFFGGYPRLVSLERGPHYRPDEEANEQLMTPLGFIPQVERTYAYFDQDYGMMNEVQLSIGESTCGAKTVGWPTDAGSHGKNLFGIAELTKIALERCESARCAVQTMGDLAVKHGFYSEDSGDPAHPDFGDSAEALVIGDRHGELWVFHVLTGPQNSSAVWAAQRVREDHVTALANGFTIREMDLSDSDWFLASDNVHSFAEEMGWWRTGHRFDFTAAYGFADKDAIGPLYTGRRVWRVFDVLAPSLQLDARLGSFSQYATYPFSIKPDRPVTLNAVMELLRDHYEGTAYDMTKGIAAGPFGAPVRWSGSAQGIMGGWERSISMHRTMFSFVLQSFRSSLPNALAGTVWYAQDAPHGSVFIPFSCGQKHIPASYLLGKQSEFHPHSAWWAFNFVNNWSLLRFNAINQDVRAEINVLQQQAFTKHQQLKATALSKLQENDNSTTELTNDDLIAFLERGHNEFASRVVDHWWQLAWTLVAKYSDGYVTTGEQPGFMESPGYPTWWLRLSEFSKWPGDSFAPNALYEHKKLKRVGSPSPLDAQEQQQPSSYTMDSLAAVVWLALGAVLGAGLLALAQKRHRREGYASLE